VGSKCVAPFTYAGAVLAAGLLASVRAGEPTARELTNMAPVLDSSSADCRSLDIGGRNCADATLAPTLRFRALYRAPGEFSLLISGAADGTPLAFCSGRKALAYDPVGATVYYSENARFTVEVGGAHDECIFRYQYYLIFPRNEEPHRILVDLRSLFLASPRAAESGPLQERVLGRNASEFVLIRNPTTDTA